ncbi:MAG: amidohydrolase family protein [Firmicutes bacterium]|nr:amidohydrolase family protein [Bacillota bacterium]
MKLYDGVIMVDSHVHIREFKSFEFLESYLKVYSLNKVNIVSLACKDENQIMQNILSALFKMKHPGHVYAYGSLMYPYYPLDDKIPGDYNFVDQVKILMDIGFDGMKMLEGKPTLRKKIGISLNSSIYDDYYSYLEKQGIPIIFHAADPETFWDKDTAPEFSFEHGWFYGDGTFPEKEDIYSEIEGILSKFPKLRVTFAHFYFLSNHIERAAAILDKFENVSFDITPGREMYDNFSKKPSEWKEFFTKYQDRIIFGTDMEDSMFQGRPQDIINTIRKFLETDDKFNNWGFEINGLALDKDVIDKIYYKNFESYAGKVPKKINVEKLLDECRKIREIAMKNNSLIEYVQEINRVIDMVKQTNTLRG